MEEAAGLLTRGSLSHRLPGYRLPVAPVAFRWASNSPHSGGTVPDSHRVPSPRSLVTAEPIIGRCRQQRFRAWVPVVLWAALIFAFSSVPSLSHRPRHLGSHPAQDRAPDRVRDARALLARAGARPAARSRSRRRALRRHATRSTSTSSAAGTPPGTTSSSTRSASRSACSRGAAAAPDARRCPMTRS